MKQADPLIAEGVHPRIITDGLDIARGEALQVLESMKIPVNLERDMLINIAKTSLRTKVHHKLADLLAEVRQSVEKGGVTSAYGLNFLDFF